MTKPSLAIDMDNTLVDTLQACLACFNRHALEPVDYAQALKRYEFYEYYGWDEEAYMDVYAQFGEEIHTCGVPYRGAMDVIHALANRYEITIVTARPIRYAAITVDWLNQYQIPYKAISFNHDKLTVCRSIQASCLIDDTPYLAEVFAAEAYPRAMGQGDRAETQYHSQTSHSVRKIWA